MIMNLNTDGNIAGDQKPAQQKRAVGRNSREHFCEQITRVEIRLSDDNRDKKSGTEDERRLPEARFAGLRPIALGHQAATLNQAVDGAIDKLVRFIDSAPGQSGNR
jgi:hypothetical protein